MASQETPQRYQNFPEAIKRHRQIFDNSLLRPLETVLPPGTDQSHFQQALSELVDALGRNSVFTGDALKDYVDPFEVWEVEGERRQPSAAVL
jgi:hypothetical protein